MSRSFSWYMADSYAMLEEKQLGIEWPERAVGVGFINYRFFAERYEFEL